jgi:hypothetical protein
MGAEVKDDSPPIATPYSPRTARNCGKVWQKAVQSSRITNSPKLIIIGHFRPYRSLMVPKISAPTLLNMSVIVIPHDTSALVTPKSFAMSVMLRETVKKSKASQVQPKKPARNMSHWCLSSSRMTAMGLRSLTPLGGLRDVGRVMRYLPIWEGELVGC